MDFEKIVMSRYAAKKFDEKTVPKEKMDKLLELIRHSASSYNFQPWKIKIIADAPTKEKLAPASYNQPQITTCSHLLVICADTDLEGLVVRIQKMMAASGAPPAQYAGFIKAISDFASRMKEPAARKCWAQKQCYIALGNALNGAKSLGLDSCPMEGFDPEQYSKILNLPAHLVPTVVVPVGYPADQMTPKLRFEKKDIVF